MKCWHCARAIEVVAGKDRVGFRDDCPGCDRALHVCLNCDLYDPAYNNSCREPMAERAILHHLAVEQLVGLVHVAGRRSLETEG